MMSTLVVCAFMLLLLLAKEAWGFSNLVASDRMLRDGPAVFNKEAAPILRLGCIANNRFLLMPKKTTSLDAFCRQAFLVFSDDNKEISDSESSCGISVKDGCFSAENDKSNQETGQNLLATTAGAITSITTSPSSSLSSPRSWLEHNRDGVYTVMRVEWRKETPSTMNVWGLDFHLRRLEYSYQKWHWLSVNKETAMNKDFLGGFIQRARHDTQMVLCRLFQEAICNVLEGSKNDDSHDGNMVWMATILWHPSTAKEQADGANHEAIQVRGHILELKNLSAPAISATLGVPRPTQVDPLEPTNTILPNRGYAQGLADCKLSSWCRERRPLEERFPLHDFAPSGTAHEIILIHISGIEHNKESDRLCIKLQLLEGLTSNLFIVDRNHVIYTAPITQVLPGFARHMVLSCLADLGYTVDEESCPELSVSMGVANLATCESWEEVFVTSSIKLVTPVETIYLNGRVIWSRPETKPDPAADPNLRRSQENVTKSVSPISSLLLAKIKEQRSRWIERFEVCG